MRHIYSLVTSVRLLPWEGKDPHPHPIQLEASAWRPHSQDASVPAGWMTGRAFLHPDFGRPQCEAVRWRTEP